MASARMGPGDPRYAEVVERRFNKRFLASPEYVRRAETTDDVVDAVQGAVREGRRVVATSGGHCLEGFASDPDVRVLVDLSPMKRVSFDAGRRAICVEAGATVGEAFRALSDAWGVVVPLGQHPAIGMGGHVAGGAFGFLCRELGLAVDYLHAVEVVTVDAAGAARAVVATREASDPDRELWWAHTGGGAGNFGVVTRHWFRSPGAPGEDPAELLPRAPAAVTTFEAEWSWADLDARSFSRLLANHGDWCERNAGADSPATALWTLLECHRKQFGKIIARGVSTAPDADRLWDEHLAALLDGVGAPPARARARMPWLDFALDPLPDLFAAPPGGVRVKVKDALLRRRLTDGQIRVVHDYLTRADHDAMGGMFGLATYGGRVNAVARDATAAVHRDCILDVACSAGWLDERDDAKNLAWARAFYRALFADTGGVPVPGDAFGGALVNHPDVDLADPGENRSGVPWHALYYREHYPRLQRVKARWDPRDVFRHALSIRPG